jgi:hypothetical protein
LISHSRTKSHFEEDDFEHAENSETKKIDRIINFNSIFFLINMLLGIMLIN